MKKEENKIVVADNSAEALISQAILNKVDVGTMERLLVMRTQIKAEKAKEAFNASMADFQAECPTIQKTKEVFTNSGRSAYKYAPIEAIIAQVKSLIQKHGFSYSFRQELKDGGVKVTCIVVHTLGHAEEYAMEVPFGSKTNVMSESQVTAAASTFAKRYAFCNAFGILTGDEDNDGAKFDTSPVAKDAVPTVTYDNPEDEINKIVPSKKKNPVDTFLKQKKEIVDLATKKTLVPLATKEEYETWILGQTGLELKMENYPEIIIRLKALA